MSFGVLISLLALLFTVQFMYDMYATSVITGLGYDAARDVAGFRNEADRSAAVDRAEGDLREALGGYAGDLNLAWTVNAESVSLTITATHPTIMPSLFGPLALDEVNETIIVRAEEPQ